MRVLVLGATGSVGRLIVEEALKRGHDVTVLVRTPDKLGAVANRVSVIQGDALDPDAVSRAVIGQDAVLYALGAGHVRQTTLFSESTRILLSAMQCNAVRRLICVTGVGAGETKGHGGFLYDHIVYRLFTKGIYADKDKQEGLIRQSPLDWTIVRPASFRERAPTGSLQVVTNVEGVTLRRISRHEVARFVLDVLEQNQPRACSRYPVNCPWLVLLLRFGALRAPRTAIRLPHSALQRVRNSHFWGRIPVHMCGKRS